jgi:hypothetical protein
MDASSIADRTTKASRSSAYRPRMDGRLAPAKRKKALIAQYVAALGGPDAVNDLLWDRVVITAELVVAAELARAAVLEGDGLLDDMVRAQRLADQAVRRLQLDRHKLQSTTPSLSEYLRAHHNDEAGT